MKKTLIGIAAVAVLGLSAFGIYNLNSSQETAQAAEEKIVKTYKDEPSDGGSGNSLATAIYNAYQFTSHVTKDNATSPSNVKTINSYEKGAIEWANKVNASQEIKEELKSALDKAEQGKFSESATILNSVNQTYNAGNPAFMDDSSKIDSALTNGIHKTAELFDRVADPNQPFSFEHSDIQTVLEYEKTTIDIANHVNTPKSVKDYLSRALKLTEQGISEKNVNKIHQAREKILELEFQFNKPKESWTGLK